MSHFPILIGKISNDSKKSVHITASSHCSPDLIYVPDDHNIVVKDVYSGTEVTTLRGHYAQVSITMRDVTQAQRSPPSEVTMLRYVSL